LDDKAARGGDKDAKVVLPRAVLEYGVFSAFQISHSRRISADGGVVGRMADVEGSRSLTRHGRARDKRAST
jgi:hypothetical protein